LFSDENVNITLLWGSRGPAQDGHNCGLSK